MCCGDDDAYCEGCGEDCNCCANHVEEEDERDWLEEGDNISEEWWDSYDE